MEIGPFNFREIESIKSILTEANLAFEVIFDKDLEQELLKRYHEHASQSPRTAAGTLDLKNLFIEIDPEDFSKVQAKLERFGISAPSDGSYELGDD